MTPGLLLHSDLALGLEAALRQAGHSLLLCSTVAQLRGQIVTSSGALEPPKTVLWVDEIPVEFGYQALTVGVRGILRKSWSVGVLVVTLEQVAAGELCFEKVLTDQL